MSVTDQLVVIECSGCHVLFAIPEAMQTQRVDDHQRFYCPNGHSQVYSGETEAQKLRRQLDYQKQRTEFWREEQAREQRSHSATKGQLTKTKKRVANGACPCCNRTFAQLGRHMATQHPDYVEPS